MSEAQSHTLLGKHCVPCEGGVPSLAPDEVARHLGELDAAWRRTSDGRKIRREWKARDFRAAMTFLDRVAELAESEAHHPDLHLTSYRDVAIEIWTHAIGGLSENDFILAAKIDALPFGR